MDNFKPFQGVLNTTAAAKEPLCPKGWAWLREHCSVDEYRQIQFLADRESILTFVKSKVDPATFQEFRFAAAADEEIAARKQRSRTMLQELPEFHDQLVAADYDLKKIPTWRSADYKPFEPDPDELVPCPEVEFDPVS